MELQENYAARHECTSRCTQVITENKPENKYNGGQINSVSNAIKVLGLNLPEKEISFSNSHASFFNLFIHFLVKLLHAWSKCK